MEKIWKNRNEYTDKKKIIEDAEKYDISTAFSMILNKRGINNIDGYLNPGKQYMHDPKLLKDAVKGSEIILKHINQGNNICIVNDYDVDGVTSGEIAYETIYYLGGNAFVITPDRNIDGYGISQRIINLAIEKNCKLILTTDNGIAATEQIQYAKEKGLEVVITDHHEVPFIKENNEITYIIPNADAVIDPKQADCNYPYKEICGASVIFKIANILFDMAEISDERLSELTIEKFKDNKAKKRFLLRRFLELVTIGTICDVMPLENENRMYVKCGLKLLEESMFIGIRQLISVHNLENKKINSGTIGFTIGPCINASGRITGNVDVAMSLLQEKDQKKAKEYAETLKNLNEERKTLSNNGTQLGLEMVKELTDAMYFINIPDLNPSICGIVAGKIKDNTGHPAIVVSKTKEGFLKGSGRSIPGVNIFEVINKYKDDCISFGGHELACGISITEENFEKLRTQVNRELSVIDQNLFIPCKIIDLFIPMGVVDDNLINDLEKMEPVGNGNEKPILAEKDVLVYKASRIGKDKNYIRLYLISNKERIEAIFFGDADTFDQYVMNKFGADKLNDLYKGAAELYMDIQFTPSFNTWNGTTTIQYIINDYKRSK